jgi:hypothetical protein
MYYEERNKKKYRTRRGGERKTRHSALVKNRYLTGVFIVRLSQHVHSKVENIIEIISKHSYR